MHPKRLAASLLLAVLVASCVSTPATPVPAGSPPTTRNPSPTASPGPTEVTPSSSGPAPTDRPATSAIAIAAGSWHTCAVMNDGGVNCWGSSAGTLGDGSTIATGVPVGVSGLASGVKSVTAGQDYTCALTDRGGVKCWGSNDYGQLGSGSTDDSLAPVDVLASSVSAISAGDSHACAVMDTGGAKCWGLNYDGQLGDSTATDGTATDSAVPVAVTQTDGVSEIAAGVDHTCAVNIGGWVSCWMHRPFDNLSDVGVTAVATGMWHTCAVTDAGGVKCWDDTGVTKDVAGLASLVSAVDAGTAFTCALTDAGGVKCWGANYLGQLGNGTTADSSVPVDVVGLVNGVRAITAGDSHACALMDDGGVKCWGSNEYGQLGNDSVTDSSVPVEVDFRGHGPTLDASSAIVHATGSTDVLLRYDHGPDRGDLLGDHFGAGGPFAPGPEFTLYGDGTVIFRDETAAPPTAKGSIVRASSFRTARLTEVQIQSLLRHAVGEGGLGIALPYYDNGGEGCEDGAWTYLLRAGGIDKRIESGGCGDMFERVAERLRGVAAGSASDVWAPGTNWGSLLEAKALVKAGALSKVPSKAVPWPWPGIALEDFKWRKDPALGREGVRVMSADETAALGVPDGGSVVERVYLRGPDGKTVYLFSMRPKLPDETG